MSRWQPSPLTSPGASWRTHPLLSVDTASEPRLSPTCRHTAPEIFRPYIQGEVSGRNIYWSAVFVSVLLLFSAVRHNSPGR